MTAEIACRAIHASWEGAHAATTYEAWVNLWMHVETLLLGMWKLMLYADAPQNEVDDVQMLRAVAHRHWLWGRHG